GACEGGHTSDQNKVARISVGQAHKFICDGGAELLRTGSIAKRDQKLMLRSGKTLELLFSAQLPEARSWNVLRQLLDQPSMVILLEALVGEGGGVFADAASPVLFPLAGASTREDSYPAGARAHGVFSERVSVNEDVADVDIDVLIGVEPLNEIQCGS